MRHKVESLPSFWPVFIILLTIFQIAAMIVILSIRGIAPIRAEPIRRNVVFPSLCNVTGNASTTFYRSVNLWIGPSPLRLIEVGARFTPCMRTDFGIQRRISNAAFREGSLGCCSNGEYRGTVVKSSCVASPNCTAELPPNTTNIDFLPNPLVCSNPNSTYPFRPGSPLDFHPCCVSITGHCLVTSREECDARGGMFHEDQDNCREVNCFRGICGFNGANIGGGQGFVVLPTANQFWRWFISLFVHLGVIHMVVLMPIQLYVGIKIERTIGWLRIGIIYLISGVGGNLVSVRRMPASFLCLSNLLSSPPLFSSLPSASLSAFSYFSTPSSLPQLAIYLFASFSFPTLSPSLPSLPSLPPSLPPFPHR